MKRYEVDLLFLQQIKHFKQTDNFVEFPMIFVLLKKITTHNSPVSNSPWPLNKSTDNALVQG